MVDFIETDTDIISYLTFELGEEFFACHVNKLLHILEIPEITEVPGSPTYMKGIIDLRGSVLPVIDTKLKLGMPQVEFTKNSCIVVMDINLDDDNLLVGMLVDNVLEVSEFRQENVLPPPNLGSKYKSNFIKGIIKKDEKFIMILDIDTVFSLDEIDFLKTSFDVDNPIVDMEEKQDDLEQKVEE